MPTPQPLAYACPAFYRTAMRLIYGRHHQARFKTIADLIEPGASVVDVCAGEGYIYLKYLKAKGNDYLGLDLSPAMVSWAAKRGIKARVFDARQDQLPQADYVIMLGSLCQFMPGQAEMIKKLLAAARQKLIVSEPVRNLTGAKNPWLAHLSRFLVAPLGRPVFFQGQRFDTDSFERLCRSFSELESLFSTPGGREMVAVFKGQAGFRSAGQGA